MACPYFYPTARLDQGSWIVPPRLPLGDAYAGECRANGNAVQPGEKHVRQICNTGYGRGCCERFPAGAATDAVRFHVAQDSGTLIRLQYVLEKNCWPVENGVMECSTTPPEISGTENAILRGQGAAFVESYLRRRDFVLASGA